MNRSSHQRKPGPLRSKKKNDNSVKKAQQTRTRRTFWLAKVTNCGRYDALVSSSPRIERSEVVVLIMMVRSSSLDAKMRFISVTYAKAKVMAVYFDHEMLDGGYWDPSHPGYHADTSTSEVALGAVLRTWLGGTRSQYCEGAAKTEGRLTSSMSDKQCIGDREKLGRDAFRIWMRLRGWYLSYRIACGVREGERRPDHRPSLRVVIKGVPGKRRKDNTRPSRDNALMGSRMR